MALNSALVDGVVEVVGARHVLTDADLVAGYTTDWTGRYRGDTVAVVRPADHEQVAAVLALCHRAGVAVVPQGGNTGLVGGAVPRDGALLLNLARLDTLGEVDPVGRQVTVGAGATLASVQHHARAHRLDVGVDLAARDSATVGGMVSTNAGGLHVLRWGSMRARVAGARAVLADGRTVGSVAGLPKDSTGYDLAGMLTGAEGTLAVLTSVRLALVPAPARHAVAVLGVTDTAAATRVLAALRGLGSLHAAEVYYADGLALVCEHLGIAPPLATRPPCYLLVECAAEYDPLDELTGALTGLDAVLDSAVATDEPGRRALWAHREGHTAAVNAQGVPLKLDVGVPPDAAAAFERDLRELVAGIRLVLFGHLAEGNFHVNLLGARDELAVTDGVLRLVARHGGTISAEHGVGVAKVDWLPLTRSPAELALMAAVKRAFDPAGLLNPGVLISP